MEKDYMSKPVGRIIGQWAGDKVSAIEREIIETHRRLEKTSQGTGNA